MSLFEALTSVEKERDKAVSGVAIAVVTNIEDPSNLGRIKIQYPWRNEEDESDWTRVLTFMAGADRGGYFLPEVNDEVLVAFENGDIDHPVVLGALWSNSMAPPSNNSDGKNNLRLIKSRSGHQIILNDEDGKETIEIIDKSGGNLIKIDTAENKIIIESSQDIELKAGNKIVLEATEIECKASANTKIEAGGNMDLKATGNATVKGAMVMIN